MTATLAPSGTATPTVTLAPLVSATWTATATPTATVNPGLFTLTVTPTSTPWPHGQIYVYPNPFNPGTAVGRVLKFDNCPRESEIKIFTVSGELVRQYANVLGRQTWDGKNQNGAEVVTGIYLFVVSSPDGTKYTGKIFLVH
jgi:hypothetical protein